MSVFVFVMPGSLNIVKDEPNPNPKLSFPELSFPLLAPLQTPTNPVSSLNSLTAHSSGDSPASIRPEGTSMTTLLRAGRNCFCRSRCVPVGRERRARIPTPSIWGVAGFWEEGVEVVDVGGSGVGRVC